MVYDSLQEERRSGIRVPISKLTDRQKSILLVALLATLGIVVAINWASRRVADLYGPSVLAQATDGRVWLMLNHELHVLDRHGTSLRRTPVRTLGISRPSSAAAERASPRRSCCR